MFKKAVLALVLMMTLSGLSAAGTSDDSSSDVSGAVQIPTCLPCSK